MALEEKLYQYLDRLKARYPLVAFIVDVIEVYLDRRVSRSSAELAYYLLLSVFPMLIMVISALGWLHLETNAVISFLNTVLPAQIMELFSDYITYVLTHQSQGTVPGRTHHVHHRLLRWLPQPHVHLRRDLRTAHLPWGVVLADLPDFLRPAAGDGLRVYRRRPDRQLVL